jgi:putative hydrolase of the HAD superfamily
VAIIFLMPGSQIRAIFFDAVGTLIHPDPPAPIVYEQVGKRFGSRYDAVAITARFTNAFKAEEEFDRRVGWQTSEKREIERWRSIVENVLDDAPEPAACFQELFEYFAQPVAWRCDPEVAELLKTLEGQGYGLGLASNYDSRLRPVVFGKPELAVIRHLCISSEIGWRKPAPEFFAVLCQLAELPAKQVLYVGDDPVNDYQGATAAGTHAILFDPRNRHHASLKEPMRAILQLSDLLPLLGEYKT